MSNNLNKYGHFSDDGTEFIVTTPNIPRPWINYLTNERYCAIISQCAGGYSFFKDCRSNRITRWLPESWHFDRPGKYIYFREPKTGKVWSATFQPIRLKPQKFQCRHGLGYTVIKTEYFGIESEITYFVPEKGDCEIWLAKITNKSGKKREIEVYPYAEWLLGDYHLELRYRNIMNLYNRIWFDGEAKAIFAKKTAFWGDLDIQEFQGEAFFSSTLAISGHATKKMDFLGRSNTEQQPESILTGNFRNSSFCSGEDGIACFKHRLSLKAGESKEFVVVLGQSDGMSSRDMIKKYCKVSEAKKELKATQTIWKGRILDNTVIKTPDKEFDSIANIWVKYQLYI